ncbi:hypothetical protein ID866_3756 [Astraeus odoratus]|nr:hypothetical protein ID866_3756 [Astraeus odoratus]
MAKNRKTVSKTSSGSITIAEEEQWRLVRESGVLTKVKSDQDAKPSSESEPEDTPSPLAEEIFNASVVIMPMTFFLIMMTILIHHQYAKHPTLRDISDRLLNTFPIMSVFMFYMPPVCDNMAIYHPST